MRGNTIKLTVQGLEVRRSTKHFKVGKTCYQSSGGVIESLLKSLYDLPGKAGTQNDLQNLNRK